MSTDKPRESDQPKSPAVGRLQFTLARLVGAVTVVCVGLACIAAGLTHRSAAAMLLAIVLMFAAAGMLLRGYPGAALWAGCAGLFLGTTALFGCCPATAVAVLMFSAWCAWASWEQPRRSP